jgi:hypothetical protein
VCLPLKRRKHNEAASKPMTNTTPTTIMGIRAPCVFVMSHMLELELESGLLLTVDTAAEAGHAAV